MQEIVTLKASTARELSKIIRTTTTKRAKKGWTVTTVSQSVASALSWGKKHHATIVFEKPDSTT